MSRLDAVLRNFLLYGSAFVLGSYLGLELALYLFPWR